MSKTKTPNIKATSVPSAYDTPMTTLEYLHKVEEQNAQVLARQDEIEEALNDRVAKSGDTMTGALNVPQVNADTGVFHHLNAVSQNGNTHAEVSNGGFIAEVTEETTGNKKYGVIAYPNGKVGFYAHDSAHNKDVNFIIPNMDDYEAGTYELGTFTPKVYDCEAMPEVSSEQSWVTRCKLIVLAPHVFAIDIAFHVPEVDSGSSYIDIITDKITSAVDASIYASIPSINEIFPIALTNNANGLHIELGRDFDEHNSTYYLKGIFTEGE